MSEQIPAEVWSRFVQRRSVGDVVDGHVVKVLPFGAFVEVDGVTGLLAPAPGGLLEGGRVIVRVATIDSALRRFAAAAA